MERLWTVARFPNGDWDTGGRVDDPVYAECETWQVMAESREKAKKKAQALRRKQVKNNTHPA